MLGQIRPCYVRLGQIVSVYARLGHVKTVKSRSGYVIRGEGRLVQDRIRKDRFGLVRPGYFWLGQVWSG
jgi:hypothetical protein